jgi:nitrogen fixation NifU-like protein
MSDLRELYQQVIIDHGRRPRNFGKLDNPTYIQLGHNPLCGDKLVLQLSIKNNKVSDVKFDGEGCAISMASASLMSEMIKGLEVKLALELFDKVHDLLVDGKSDASLIDQLGKLAVLQGVCAYPARVKCATLAWQSLKAALSNQADAVTTE